MKNNKEADELNREELIGNLIYNTGLFQAKWLKENDKKIYDKIIKSEKWEKEFNYYPIEREIFIEVSFDKKGMRYKAIHMHNGSGVVPSLNNQNTWGEKSWENMSTEKIRTYHDGVFE